MIIDLFIEAHVTSKTWTWYQTIIWTNERLIKSHFYFQNLLLPNLVIDYMLVAVEFLGDISICKPPTTRSLRRLFICIHERFERYDDSTIQNQGHCILLEWTSLQVRRDNLAQIFTANIHAIYSTSAWHLIKLRIHDYFIYFTCKTKFKFCLLNKLR